MTKFLNVQNKKQYFRLYEDTMILFGIWIIKTIGYFLVLDH